MIPTCVTAGARSEDLSIKKAVVPGAWQAVRFEHVERVHRDGQCRLRIALDSSRIEYGRLEATRVQGQIKELNRSLTLREETSSRQRSEFEAAIAGTRVEADTLRREL